MPKNISRIKRVSDIIHRSVAVSIREDFKDPRIGMVTISTVEISPDLKYAKIFVTVFEEAKIEETLKILNNASGFFKRHIAKSLELRFTPRLRFVFDETIVRANRILSLLESCAGGS